MPVPTPLPVPPSDVLRWLHRARESVKPFTMGNSAASPVVTLRQIAEAAGVSVAAVSYALRRNAKIPEATQARVLALAAQLGYRPNPRVASLMAHIRRGHVPSRGERIAFVWVHTSRSQSRRNPFLRRVHQAARRRAEQMGFAVEEFWTADAGMTDRRLAEILRHRGIVGVVLSPVMTDESAITLDWDWRHFAAAGGGPRGQSVNC